MLKQKYSSPKMKILCSELIAYGACTTIQKSIFNMDRFNFFYGLVY